MKNFREQSQNALGAHWHPNPSPCLSSLQESPGPLIWGLGKSWSLNGTGSQEPDCGCDAFGNIHNE
jgi:hypothetical protein